METITVYPVGTVESPRKEMTDDYWGDIVSVIHMDSKQYTEEATAGLESFSHLEVVFYMNQVSENRIQTGARHPRNRTDWPKTGIFAQRAKARPNRIGVSRCQLLRVEGLALTVKALDAIHGTPVLDVKPYMKEFGPEGPVRQPEWSTEVMKHYYLKGSKS
ncbi:SAM-dependent methyltransferase [Paludifilum halophilum]|uniref:tRNA (N6-threonylcarbamoyladenosine(37)-N6)-methyltransferase TrmO n=1 Tax=Paludifilum halophilum TaxID=1642702 RepID=A0A235B286_9BACL|nr:SAM-dependent methyltransferase [Paludifilum halophilum]OYD06341.1 tRNA (N6-threonylcarbamoyladenosine(37)-N6)-methyltransferase TrmO [Paludifilum halophilum]